VGGERGGSLARGWLGGGGAVGRGLGGGGGGGAGGGPGGGGGQEAYVGAEIHSNLLHLLHL
jgi:hypothetical protein